MSLELTGIECEDDSDMECDSLVPKSKYSDEPSEIQKRRLYKKLQYKDGSIKYYIKSFIKCSQTNPICIWLSDNDNRFGCIIYTPILLLTIYLIIYILTQAYINTPNVRHNIYNNLIMGSWVDKYINGNNYNNINSNPHIIWFIVDDLGYSDISLHDSEYSTPNIDNLAKNGIELTSHYTNPICSPSRASFLTGRYAFRMGLQGKLEDLIHPGTTAHIPSKYSLISDYLKLQNYDTYLYGKWHAGYSKKSYTPNYRGFNKFLGFYGFGIDYYTKLNYDQWTYNGYDWHKNNNIQISNNNQYTTNLLINEIINDLNNYNNDNPLFMYIAFQNPHFSVETPNNWNGYGNECININDVDRSNYCKHVQYLDYAIGKVINSLKNNKLYSNSLILLATDNGASGENLCGNVGGHEASGSNYPYRAGKYTLFEGGIRTNAFISGGIINDNLKNTKYNDLFHATDWLPTILHVINNGKYVNNNDYSNELIKYDIDGYDMWDVIINKNKDNPRTDNYIILNIDYNYNTKQFYDTAILYNNYKLIWNTHLLWKDGSCDIRTPKPGTYPFISIVNDLSNNENWKEFNNMLLFNIKTDPTESNDLLNGNGNNGNEYTKYQTLIETMINFIKKEFNNEKMPFMPRQPWTIDNFDISTYNSINGTRVPWQDENAPEYPNDFINV